MPIEDFYYAQLIECSYRRDTLLNVQASESAENGKFFSLTYDAMPEDVGAGRGWKFAISINDQDRTERIRDFNFSPNLARAWNIAVEVLLQNDIRVAKVIHPVSTPMSNLPGERNFSKDNKRPQTIYGLESGKQITIYASRHPHVPHEKWQEIFQEITDRFIQEEIRPSCRAYGSKILGKNPYISYRNDSTPHGKYQGVSRNYNPYHFPDPYSDMRFDNIPYIEIPSWPFEEVLTEEEEVANIQPVLEVGNQSEAQDVLVQEIIDNDGGEESQEESYYQDNALSDQETSDKELPTVDSSLSKKTHKVPSAMLSAASQGILEEEISDHEETVGVGMIENQEENEDNKENQSNCCKCRLL